MRCEFSESTYAFAHMHECIERYGFSPVPVFLSQQVEGKKGYDTKSDCNGRTYLFQFKVPEWMERSLSWEHKWHNIRLPYLRFYFHQNPRNPDIHHQHNRLVEWNRQYPDVYYASPEFWTDEELSHLTRHAEVVSHSAWFMPLDIGAIPDTDMHRMTYKPGEAYGYFMSESKKLIKRLPPDVLKEMRYERLDRKYFTKMLRSSIELIRKKPEPSVPSEGLSEMDVSLISRDSVPYLSERENQRFKETLHNVDSFSFPELLHEVEIILISYYGLTMVFDVCSY